MSKLIKDVSVTQLENSSIKCYSIDYGVVLPEVREDRRLCTGLMMFLDKYIFDTYNLKGAQIHVGEDTDNKGRYSLYLTIDDESRVESYKNLLHNTLVKELNFPTDPIYYTIGEGDEEEAVFEFPNLPKDYLKYLHKYIDIEAMKNEL